MTFAFIQRHLLSLLMIAALLLAVMALAIGSVIITIPDMIAAFFGHAEPQLTTVMVDIRLPRVLLAFMVGAALSLSGAALQGTLHNPLADPGIIGVSASAALGAVIAIYFNLAAIHPLALPALAIAAAFIGTAALYFLAARDASVLTLILAGVAISSLASALMALAMNFAPNPFQLNDIVLWLLGSLANRSFVDVWLSLPFIAFGAVLLLSASRDLDALTLGEDVAASLGVNIAHLRWRVVIGSALAVGASVAVAGAIGFVGLVVPHLLRPLTGYQPSRLLLPAAIGGGMLLMLADIAVRLNPTTQELKLGVLTALIGAPFFLYLIIVTRRRMR